MIRQGTVFVVPCMLAMLFCGCIPAPHRTQAIPSLSGKVLHDDVPIQGAAIDVTYGLGRKKTSLIGTTDRDGAFTYAGKKDFHFFAVIGDPGFDWLLTIRTPDATYRGYADHGLGYVPEKTTFTCELSRPGDQPACDVNP